MVQVPTRTVMIDTACGGHDFHASLQATVALPQGEASGGLHNWDFGNQSDLKLCGYTKLEAWDM